jgi:outer membrane protein assembly factor BamB
VVKNWIIVPSAKEGPTVALRVDAQLAGKTVAESSNVRWVLPQTPDVSIPLVSDGLVYNLQKDGRFQCVNLETGAEVYFERTHTSQHRASPVLIGSHIYLCAKDGMTTVVKAGPKFEIVAKNNLEEPITASPAVADGTLYIRTYNALYAIQ